MERDSLQLLVERDSLQLLVERDSLQPLVERDSLLPLREQAALLRLIAAARETVTKLASTRDWHGDARWVHGDLYARHLLLDERKRVCGVIDWGDVHAGETADDLAIAYSFRPRTARREFFEAYGEVDDATKDRARLYALHSGAVAGMYGWEVADQGLVEVGKAALEFAAE